MGIKGCADIYSYGYAEGQSSASGGALQMSSPLSLKTNRLSLISLKLGG